MSGAQKIPAFRIRDPFVTVEETVWCTAPNVPPPGFRNPDELKTTALRKKKLAKDTKTLASIKQSQFQLQKDVIDEADEKKRARRRKRRKERKQREEVRKIMLYKAAGVDVSELVEVKEEASVGKSSSQKKKESRGREEAEAERKAGIARAIGGEVRMSQETRLHLLATLADYDKNEQERKEKIREEIRLEKLEERRNGTAKKRAQAKAISLDNTLKKMEAQPELWAGAKVKDMLQGAKTNEGPETDTPILTPTRRSAVKSAW